MIEKMVLEKKTFPFKYVHKKSKIFSYGYFDAKILYVLVDYYIEPGIVSNIKWNLMKNIVFLLTMSSISVHAWHKAASN